MRSLVQRWIDRQIVRARLDAIAAERPRWEAQASRRQLRERLRQVTTTRDC